MICIPKRSSTLPIALVATDVTGRIRSTNRAAEELLGLPVLEKDAQLGSCFPRDQLLQEKIAHCLHAGEGCTLDSHNLQMATGDQNVVNIYLQPLRDDEKDLCGLLIALEDQTYISFLQNSVQRYGSPLQPGPVVAESKAMKQVMERVAELGGQTEPALLTGEAGCGKTFIARKIHDAGGHAASAPYFVIDCRTLTDKDPREFLFGSGGIAEANREEIRFRSVHDYGAIHLADGGSLVLQHIEVLPLDAQEALLDYLQRERSGFLANVQARIMTTSCADLRRLAEAGEFNPALANLLLANNLKLPTLWERRKDILSLARLFLQEAEQGTRHHFSKMAENILISRRYNYNNARELKEAVALAALVSSDAEILPEHIFTGPKEEDAPFEFELSRIPFIRWALQDRVLGPLRYLVLSFFTDRPGRAVVQRFSDRSVRQQSGLGDLVAGDDHHLPASRPSLVHRLSPVEGGQSGQGAVQYQQTATGLVEEILLCPSPGRVSADSLDRACLPYDQQSDRHRIAVTLADVPGRPVCRALRAGNLVSLPLPHG